MSSKKLLLAVVVALGILFLSRYKHLSQDRLARGNFAPDFTLDQLRGAPVELSSYRGKVVVLDFWATWCQPCREEIPAFVSLQNKYGPQGLQIIGISMDDTSEPVREFYEQFQMNYPVVMGNAKIGELYGGVLGLPIAFLVGRDGRIWAKHIGAVDIVTLEKEIVKQVRAMPEAQHEFRSGSAIAIWGKQPTALSYR